MEKNKQANSKKETPESKIIIKIFLASTMDLTKERAAFKNVIKDINSKEGKEKKYELVVLGWEDCTRPGSGEDAQDVVNGQIPDYDILACIFKDKLGTPTNRAESGTVEEFERSDIKRIRNRSLKKMVYFIDSPNREQRLTEFKARVASGSTLFWDVNNPDEFSTLIRKHFVDEAAQRVDTIREAERRKKLEELQRASYVAIVYKNQVLMLQRSSKSRLGAGQWQLVGGKAEQGETPRQTALREVREETGHRIKGSCGTLTEITTLHSHLDNDKTRPFDITLFVHHVAKKFKPTLDSESDGYMWMPLTRCELCNKIFFRHNRRMLNSVWREIYVTSTLRKLQDYLNGIEKEATDEFYAELPDMLPTVTRDQLHSAYAMLSLFGVLDIGARGFQLKSKYSRKLLEEIISVLSNSDAIFRDDKNIFRTNRKLSQTAKDQLSDFKNRAFCSNDALVSLLSLDAKMENDTRQVCDLLIFGRHREEVEGKEEGSPDKYVEKQYILLRWDFLANKYQFIAKGVDPALPTLRHKIDHVLDRRLPTLKELIDYELIASYTAGHFSAGSVSVDPIWRDNLVDVSVLIPRKTVYGADIERIIRESNAKTEQYLESALSIDRDTAKTLNYFVWCELDELIMCANSYRSKKVSGMPDLLDAITGKDLTLLAGTRLTSIELPTLCATDDNVQKYHETFERKFTEKQEKK